MSPSNTTTTRRFISPASEESKRLQQEIEFLTNEEESVSPVVSSSSSVDNSPLVESDTTPKLPLSIDQLYEAERATNKVNYWRNNYYAVGLVEPTWNDELRRMVGTPENDKDDSNGPNRRCCEDMASEQIDPACGCLICSALVCRLKTGRIGNMVVLKESSILAEVPQDKDDEKYDGTDVTHKVVRQRKIDIIVGPYWPCLVFVTFPMVILLSLVTAIKAVFVPGQYLLLQMAWLVLTIGLLLALCGVGCRDPGIVRKYRENPFQSGPRSSEWKWNDRAQSFKPKNAFYDPDCAVVIEEFDHTCPWTGTAIGKKNMLAFQMFVGLVFICLPMDIFLLASMAT